MFAVSLSPRFAPGALGVLLLGTGASAQHLVPAPTPALTLDTVVVESESHPLIQEPFLPAVSGTTIYSGKKTSVIDLDALPAITNNNYRQALAKTPGLYLSEESTPLVSIGYRGLNPNRVQFTQVLRDGIPIHADQFGYPEAYFTPPLDTVDRMEFLRGGASLVYGPQPGGALNYVTHRPAKDRRFGFGTNQTFGSNQYYSTFNYVEGTNGRLGYYAYFNHRQTEGFRERNSDVRLNAGLVKLVLDGQTDSRWILTLDGYEENHGEPGGLTLRQMRSNPRVTTRPFDRFELRRSSISLQWERDFSEDTKMVSSAWATSYRRWSRRQEGGGFGTLPAANTFLTQDQKFFTVGVEQRWRHDYEALGGGKHSLSAGFQWYRTVSPRRDFSTSTARNRQNKDSDREVTYLPFFLENRFAWGRFSITPGIRLENAWQGVRENANNEKTEKGVSLLDASNRVLVPLFGIGASYELAPKIEIYTNVSQSYRPKVWTEAVPINPNAVMPRDLEEGRAWQYEIGFKGRPKPWIYWDASVFLLDFDNQIGQVTVPAPGGTGTSYENVGRAQHLGLEMSGELDLLGFLWGSKQNLSPNGNQGNTSGAASSSPFGSLSLYANATFLDAEFVSGTRKGKTPSYAARYMVRSGMVYRTPEEGVKVALTSSFVGRTFGSDDNSAARVIPSYAVWDLTGETRLYKDFVSLNWGVNNLFDKNYFSRMTDTGIDPVQGRNFYGGLSLKF